MALEMRALGEHEAKKRLALEAGDHEKAREHHETCDFFFKELKPKMLWYRAGCPELKEISVD